MKTKLILKTHDNNKFSDEFIEKFSEVILSKILEIKYV